MAATSNQYSTDHDSTDKPWLNLRQHDDGRIMTPEELEPEMKNPPDNYDRTILDRIHGSMIGMALGDALGAHVEFRPHTFLVENPVTDLEGGGTWGLKKGQFTDDTSMALCLANSLVVRQDYDPYDQLVRYKWWFRHGYMSSTGKCFDIGSATKHSLLEFERRQKQLVSKYNVTFNELDSLPDSELLENFNVECSEDGVAGNGALMRLAPMPLFFYRHPIYAVEYSGHSGRITHGDEKAYDACRYYGALIVAAVHGATREELLDTDFYKKHEGWFSHKRLDPDIERIAEGSYQQRGGYDKGIRGKGYVVNALEAALWAFWSDKDSFETGVLKAVNLGDDTDTTAAIYGQLAGAYYGYRKLPTEWADQIYAKKFIKCLSKWIAYEGEKWSPQKMAPLTNPSLNAPDEDARPRSNSRVEADSSLKPPASDTHNRPKSSEYKNIHSQPHRIYRHKTMKSADDVYQWFVRLGDDYVTYANTFKNRHVDSKLLLNYMNDEKLKEFGIKNEHHRQVILEHIQKLKAKCPVEFSTVMKS